VKEEASSTVSISEFKMLTNFDTSGDTVTMEMDLSGGPYQGIVLPSQTGFNGDRTIKFSFRVQNNSSENKDIAYKIFYQNESYKYPEILSELKYNKKSEENFYGSWVPDAVPELRIIKDVPPGMSLEIIDSLIIVGNPLNDRRYFGLPNFEAATSEDRVNAKIEAIKNTPEWYKAVKEKAENEGRSLSEQLRLDAIYILKKDAPPENLRWRRNPRVGTYNFIIVGGDAENLNTLPEYARNIASGGDRINPFYYFLYGEGQEKSKLGKISVLESDRVLKTFAVLRPSNGLFFDPNDFGGKQSTSQMNCGSGEDLKNYAHFKQFLNVEVKDSSLHNIDLKANVVSDGTDLATFNSWAQSTDRNIPSFVTRPETPCANAWYDESIDALVVQNSGNASRPYKKENAGIEGRIGFAYGKFRARIKFPELLSTGNVWNGITAAYWLKFHSLENWNTRDLCNNRGYLKTGYSKEEAIFEHEDSYSEIDIEIVKTSRNWPATSYHVKDTVKYYNPAEDDNLIVSTTNWDLACVDPENFGSGIQRIDYAGHTFFPHRWSEYYKALTNKTERQHDATVGEVLLYEIDWRPEEIIWRIGRETHSMDTIGYMNSSITKIPNNQMVPVMSQEFHYGHWWPMTPFSQSNIPYPDDPITGYLYEIVIE
jgi:hypothetical protein